MAAMMSGNMSAWRAVAKPPASTAERLLRRFAKAWDVCAETCSRQRGEEAKVRDRRRPLDLANIGRRRYAGAPRHVEESGRHAHNYALIAGETPASLPENA